MVNLRSLTASSTDTGDALATLAEQLDDDTNPAFVCAFYDAVHDDRQISWFLQQRFPAAAVIGGTASAGKGAAGAISPAAAKTDNTAFVSEIRGVYRA